MADFHSMSSDSVIAFFKSDIDGISDAEASKRLKANGENILKEENKCGVIKKFFSQLADFSIIILLIAAAVSFALSYISGEKDFTDTIVILAIVLLNAVIGVFQESKAEKSLEALKNISAPEATVIRSGKQKKIPAREVVAGDILSLSAGDMVSADARIISAVSLKTDESALTGESLPCEKSDAVLSRADLPIADRKNTAFSSTLVVSGHCKAIVTSTGMNTEIGKIADMLSEKGEDTPLQKRLSSLSKYLGLGALACCAVIFVLGIFRKNDILDSFMLAVSLAVAAIPEGLPAIVTIVLSRGVGKLAARGAVIRHLPSCETLGNATVICSDKTGTLTKNKMTVTKVWLPKAGAVAADSKLSENILKYGALCSNCTVTKQHGKSKITGDPTENAIVAAALKNGYTPKSDDVLYKRIKELPFDSTRKMMTTVNRLDNGYIVISKGSPEHIIKKCAKISVGNTLRAITPADIRTIEKYNGDMAGEALRVLAVAFKKTDALSAEPEKELVFLGLIGMEDPPRKEAIQAVKECKEAGITPIMITGDQLLTAKVIAKRIGIYGSENEAVTGSELDNMSDSELKKRIKNIRVYARVTPEHKMRIVKIFKELGETVAMTGDGINDAPALKAADIGCAMGKSGTDVAKNASDLVLTDDNFSTIVNAVSIGRGLFDNIKKAVRFLLSCNIGEIMLIFFSSLLGLPTPLLPVQLLWLNLVTDSLPAMALGAEKPEKDIMKRLPAKKSEGIITKTRAFDIAIEGFLFGGISLLAFVLGKNMFSLEVGRTMAFCTLSLGELFHALNVRTDKSVFKISPFENPELLFGTIICIALQIGVVVLPPAALIFSTVALNKTQWLIVGALCLVPLIVTEAEKLIEEIKKKKQ